MRLSFKITRLLFCVLSIAFLSACHKPATKQTETTTVKKESMQVPAWLKQKISDFEKANPTNPPIKIYSYRYQNREVYFITGRCCDIPSEVYSVEGQLLCQPDGGITGRGDGKCPDFFQTRTEENLIWEDLRKQN